MTDGGREPQQPVGLPGHGRDHHRDPVPGRPRARDAVRDRADPLDRGDRGPPVLLHQQCHGTTRLRPKPVSPPAARCPRAGPAPRARPLSRRRRAVPGPSPPPTRARARGSRDRSPRLRHVRPPAPLAADLAGNEVDEGTRLHPVGEILGDPDHQAHLLAVHRPEHHEPVLDAGPDPVQHLPERLRARRLAPGREHPEALDVHGLAEQGLAFLHGELAPRLLELALKLARPHHHLPHPFLEILGVRLHEGHDARLPLLESAHPRERAGAGHRLDAPYPGRDAGLGHDLEQAHVAGANDVGSAAELERHVADGEHPHVRVVLLAEEGDRAALERVVERHGLGADVHVVEDPGVDEALDLLPRDRTDGLEVREVEAAADPARRATRVAERGCRAPREAPRAAGGSPSGCAPCPGARPLRRPRRSRPRAGSSLPWQPRSGRSRSRSNGCRTPRSATPNHAGAPGLRPVPRPPDRRGCAPGPPRRGPRGRAPRPAGRPRTGRPPAPGREAGHIR